jgi:hypothetical protein
MKNKLLVVILFILLGILLAGSSVTVFAGGNGQETCPHTGDWVKYDGLSGHSFTMPSGDIPAGWYVADNCVKYATNVDFGSGDTVVSDGKHEISHASFLLKEREQEPEEANAKLTFICKASEDGYASAYVGGGVFDSVPVNAGDYIFRVKNYGQVNVTSWFAKIAGNLIQAGGALPVGGHEFFTVQSAMAGLHLETTPINKWRGTSSTNETLCEMVPPPPPPPPDEVCETTAIGELFYYERPDGSIISFASWDKKDDGSFWLPSTSILEKCVGPVTLTSLQSQKIVRDCNGNISVQVHSCTGTAPFEGCYK